MFFKSAKQSTGSVAPNGKAAPFSVIGSDVRIVGDIITKGEMHVDGQVEGDLICETLVVGETGCITGEVVAGTMRIYGSVNGKIQAQAVLVAKSGHITGDVSHESLQIEAGAHIQGHLLRREPQPEAQAQAAQARQAERDDGKNKGKNNKGGAEAKTDAPLNAAAQPAV